MGNVHTNFSLIVYIFPRKIFLIYMRKETGKLSEKIRQIQKGNKEEIVEVINQSDPLIKKYQRILYKDAAEDVRAEMILALWEAVLRIKCIESEAQCVKYLMNALKNKFYELYRKSRHKNDNETRVDEFIAIEKGYIDKDYADITTEIDVKKFLQQYKGMKYEIMYLIMVEHLSDIKIADRLGISRQYVNRQRRELQQNYIEMRNN